ncbi:Serine/threonine-protein kinase PknD [compost metagenome]
MIPFLKKGLVLASLSLVFSCNSATDNPVPPGTIVGATGLLIPSLGPVPTPPPKPSPVAPSLSLMTSPAFSSILAGGNFGGRDGVGEDAQFGDIKAMVLDLEGNILVADAALNVIRKVTLSGEVSTVAGTGRHGKLDGKANEATFNDPTGISIDGSGNMYVADSRNNRIRKVTNTGDVLTLTRTRGWYAAPDEGLQYDINRPHYIAAKKDGEVFVVDSSRQILKVTPNGEISVYLDGHSKLKDKGWVEDIWFNPDNLAFDANGDLLFADGGNRCIWRATSAGVAERILGRSYYDQGFVDGEHSVAKIGQIEGMAYDRDGNLYFSDSLNFSLRVLTKDGHVRTLIGDGVRGNILGVATEARLGNLGGVVFGRDGHVYLADAGNRRILRVALR